MEKAEFLEKLDKANGKQIGKQKGKWRLIYIGNKLVWFGEADIVTNTPKANTVEPLNTEKKGLARIKELGLVSIEI